MQQSSLLTTIMPVAVGIIMLGLGLSLTTDDFRRIVQYPKAVFVGLFCQMFLLPVLCLLIAANTGLSPALSVGLMLLAAAPGEPVANLYSHLSNGDVALNVTLTATNSILALLSLPLIVNFALRFFLEQGQYIPMPFQKVIEVFAIVLTPVVVGMLLKRRSPAFAERMSKPVKVISAVFLVLVIAAAIIKERENLVAAIQQVGWPVLLFNITSLGVGYLLPLLIRIPQRQAVAIGMEVGIHNATLAIYIALSVLNDPIMAIPPAIYGVLMFFTAAAFGYIVSRR
ncbi:MAG: bile acid:sodium symporter family protein [Spirosomataceae bacterium]